MSSAKEGLRRPRRGRATIALLIVLPCLVGAVGPADGQNDRQGAVQNDYPIDRTPARTLTLQEALGLAKRNNRDIKAAMERLRIAHADVERALAVLLPKLGVQGKYTFNSPEISVDFSSFGAVLGTFGSVITDQIASGQYKPSAAVVTQLAQLKQQQLQLATALPTGPAVIVPRNQLDANFSLTVPIIAPPAYPAYKGTKHAYRSQVKQTEATEAQLLQAVAGAFYAAAGSDELVMTRRHGIEVASQTLDNARSRLEAGVVNRVEVTRAELALIQAQQRLLESEDSRASAYRMLATLILLRDPFRVAAPGEPLIDARSDGDLVSQALSQRPEIASLEATILAARSQVLSAKLRWLPSLSGFGGIRVTNAPGFSSGNNAFYAAGVQLDWQIFDGFDRDATRHSFEAQASDAALRLVQLRDTIADDVLNARRQAITKKEGLKSAQRSVQLARETLDLVRIQHDAGTATQLDLLTAQDQLVQAEVGLAQARFDVSLSDIGLRRTVGTFPGTLPPETEVPGTGSEGNPPVLPASTTGNAGPSPQGPPGTAPAGSGSAGAGAGPGTATVPVPRPPR